MRENLYWSMGHVPACQNLYSFDQYIILVNFLSPKR